jgi:hypothetical protein
VRVRNVKCTNWGNRTTAQPGFVVALIIGDPDSGSTVASADDAIIEDCIAVSPSVNNNVSGAVVNVLHIGGRDLSSNALTLFGLAPVIRNCFVDCGSPAPTAPAPEYRALSMGACKGGVVEGNQIHNVKIGGPYQERQSAMDIIVRNNTYRNVVTGPYWKLGSVVTAYNGGSLTRSGTVATITITSNAGLRPGDRIKLVTTSPSTFSGVYVVKTVDPTQPKFTVDTSLSDNSASVSSVDKLFSVGRIVFDGNHIELAVGLSGVAAAFLDDSNGTGYVEPPDYVNGDFYARNNKSRYVDGAAPTGSSDLSIVVKGAKRVLVTNNVVESAYSIPLQNQRCGSVTYFNNRTPSGVLVRGWNVDGAKKYDELETEAEDALVLSLFNER